MNESKRFERLIECIKSFSDGMRREHEEEPFREMIAPNLSKSEFRCFLDNFLDALKNQESEEK